MANTKRTVRQEIRLHPEELAEWKAEAIREGKNLSDLIRSKVKGAVETGIQKGRLQEPIQVIDPALIRALGKIGNNLNQIARALNICAKEGTPIQIIEVLVLLNDINANINGLLPQLPEPPSKTRKTVKNIKIEHLDDAP